MKIHKLYSALICVTLIALLCVAAHAEIEEEVIRPLDVDGGYWVEAYADFLDTHHYYWEGDYTMDDPFIRLVDIDLDGIPELMAKTEWGRWYDSGLIVKITDEGIIEYYSPELFECDSNLALCIDSDGNFGWYEETFSAGTGLQYTTVNRISITPEMEIIHDEWFSYGTEQVFNEETGDVDFVNIGYRVYGQDVDYDTYRLEEIKRRQLRVLFSNDRWYCYPQDWETAINEYSVVNTSR